MAGLALPTDVVTERATTSKQPNCGAVTGANSQTGVSYFSARRAHAVVGSPIPNLTHLPAKVASGTCSTSHAIMVNVNAMVEQCLIQ